MNIGALILTPLVLAASASWAQPQAPANAQDRTGAPTVMRMATWEKLTTERYPGKQDDIFFINDRVGWYGNGAGKVFRTTDGGDTWIPIWEQKGTFVRTLAFVDEKVGVLGNIGVGYFPGVTDPTPLYRTEDGGVTWTPVTTIEGAPVVGLCAFDIVQVPFINAGRLDYRTRIVGVGRVGGPAAYIWSDDLGKTWKQGKLPALGAAAFDVKFLDDRRGPIRICHHRWRTDLDPGHLWQRSQQDSSGSHTQGRDRLRHRGGCAPDAHGALNRPFKEGPPARRLTDP